MIATKKSTFKPFRVYILVMNEGRLVEQGRHSSSQSAHEELLARGDFMPTSTKPSSGPFTSPNGGGLKAETLV